jgi:Na+-translocating ferredoxin:NAD+ oxidoreductase subunit C
MMTTGFLHNIHPPERKELTATLPIRRMPPPAEVVLPVRQHAGRPAKVVVTCGDRVQRGDTLAVADGFISSPVHASASGRVTAIEQWPHPDGTTALAIRIAVDRESTPGPPSRMVPDWRHLSAEQIVTAIQDAGVVGLGGATVPAHVNLAPPKSLPADVLLINAAECEPYLTTNHRSMVEFPDRVHLGIRVMLRALGIRTAVIGIEATTRDAIDALRASRPADLHITVLPLSVKYPPGAERMLIRTALGLEVPPGTPPISAGVVVQSVGSAAMIGEVFETGLPLVERIVTVTGHGLARPANLVVPVGTKLCDVLAYCGGVTRDAADIIFGGPLMGLPVSNLNTPILKGTPGVVVLTRSEVRRTASYPCIRCGYCLEACPMSLDPQHLGTLAMTGRYQDMQPQRLADCMLCGSCAYVCPSNIPLNQLFQKSKTVLQRVQVNPPS